MDKEDVAVIVTELTKQLKNDETLSNLGSSVANLTGQMIGVQSTLKTLTDDNRNAFSKIDGLHVKIDGLHCLKEKEIDNMAEVIKSNSEKIGAVERDIEGKTGFAKGINWTVVILGGMLLTVAGIVVSMIFF